MIELPTSPSPSNIAWAPIDFGGILQSPIGGTAQRVNFAGNRWSVTVAMPPMTFDQAREWEAKLTQANTQGARWTIVQPNVVVGSPGTVLVNGGSQSGTSLVCDGVTPGYFARIGQMVSIVTGGNRYCYKLAQNARADASGNITLTLTDELREEPADNDVVEVGLPKLEGLLSQPPGWNYNVDRVARGFTFTLSEIR